jgi:hypothetical protein
MKNNIESDFQPLGNPKSESASAHVGITARAAYIAAKAIDSALIAEAQPASAG